MKPTNLWQERGKNRAIEVKYADAPRMTKSMASASADLELEHLWVVYPGNQEYALDKRITTLPVADIGADWVYPES